VKRSNVRALRLKYRALRKRGYLYAHIQGPRVVATNFALDGWTHALGGFFTRHGNRRYGQNSVAPLLRRLQSETLQRGISRWLVDLRPEDRNRPDFIYGHLRQRFPHRSAEAERQWIVRLRRRLLRTEREEGPAPPPPSDQRLRMDLPPGTLELDPPLEEVSLERAHLDQLNLRWHAPGRIYLSPLCLPLWGLAAQRRRSVVGAGGRRAVVPPLGGGSPFLPRPRRRSGRRPPPLRSLLEARRERLGRILEARRRTLLEARPQGRWLGRRATAPGAPLRLRRRWRRLGEGLTFWRQLRRRLGHHPRHPLPTPLLRSMPRWKRLEAFRSKRWERRWESWRRRPPAALRRLRRRREGRPHRRLRRRRRTPPAERFLLHLHEEWPTLQREEPNLLSFTYQRRASSSARWRRLAPVGAPGTLPHLLTFLGRRSLSPSAPRHRWHRWLRRRLRALGEAPGRRLEVWGRTFRRALDRLRRRRRLKRRRRSLPPPLPQPRFRLRTESSVPRHKRHGYDRRGRRLKGFTQRMLARLLPKKRHKRPDYSVRAVVSPLLRRRRRPSRLRLRRALRTWRRLGTLWGGLTPLRRRLSRRRRRLRTLARREGPTLQRSLRHRPRIAYAIREVRLLPRLELEENAELHEHPGHRFLLVERRMGRVGYGPLLADAFSLLTPALRLRAQVVGHKSARRTIYSVQSGVSLELRRRLLFGWLRNLVNKNDDFNRLRRNVIRKKPSKRVRLKPERGRRLIHSFRPRLGSEFRRLVEGDEPLLELLETFLDQVGHQKATPAAHFR
jgi:hypothetical protein